jgi:hypothetical protein
MGRIHLQFEQPYSVTLIGDLEVSHGLVMVAERVEFGILERRTTPFFRAYSGPTTSRSTNRGSRRPHSHTRDVDLATFDIFCRTDATFNDRRLAQADSAFESKPWAGR